MPLYGLIFTYLLVCIGNITCLLIYPTCDFFKAVKLKIKTLHWLSGFQKQRITWLRHLSNIFLLARYIYNVRSFILIGHLIWLVKDTFVWCPLPASSLGCSEFHPVSNEQRLWTGIVCRKIIVFINFYQRCQGVLVTSQVHAKVCVAFEDASEQCVAPEIDRFEFCIL